MSVRTILYICSPNPLVFLNFKIISINFKFYISDIIIESDHFSIIEKRQKKGKIKKERRIKVYWVGQTTNTAGTLCT